MPWANNGGTRIHYRIEGIGLPVLLQHGAASDMTGWDILGYTERLSPMYTLILVDARGCGQSDKPHDPDAYTSEQRAGDITAVLDAAGVNQCNFVGHSMGGQIGFDLGVHAPQRLKSAVFASTAPALATASGGLDADSLRRFSEGVGSLHWLNPDQQTRLAAMFLRTDIDAANAIAEAGRHRDREMYREALLGLKCPVLFTCGTEDPRFEAAQEIAAEMPTAALVPLEGADHIGGIDANRLLPALTAFLQGNTG